MILVALKGLLGRKLRATLTAVAIVLGVAMVSGTYVLTDTIKAAFNTVFTQVYKNTDAVITGKSAIGGNANNGSVPPSFPESLLGRVRTLPGVQEAEGGITDQASLVGRNGKVISGMAGPGPGVQRGAPRRPALQPARARARALAGRRTRDRDRPDRGREEALLDRRHDRRDRTRAGA